MANDSRPTHEPLRSSRKPLSPTAETVPLKSPALKPSPLKPPATTQRDEDLERERLQPGLNAEGTGGAGATPGKRKGFDNSNT